ncbi:30S ribosomal protein S8 [Candidatus Saccharibacteria bacterium]|nr:30S ribosomal protein S8 [Candidatus Saccharibacteria bacterium]
MVSTDPISDMLTRIRNANLVRKPEVSVPYSKMKESVAKLLQQNDYIKSVKTDGKGIEKHLVLTVSSESENPSITEIKRLSKPGRRQYVNVRGIPTVKRGRGIVIISTSQGVMTGDEARAKRVGGELICKVY